MSLHRRRSPLPCLHSERVPWCRVVSCCRTAVKQCLACDTDELRQQAKVLLRHYPQRSDLEALQPHAPDCYGPSPPTPCAEGTNVSANLISIDREVMRGEPCFAGSRVPISIVLACLDAGEPLSEVKAAYAFLTDDHVAAAYAFRRSQQAAPVNE